MNHTQDNNSRLKVCLVVPGFSSPDDVNCIPALHHFATLLARHHDVTVVSLRYPHTATPYDFDGLRVLPLGGGDVGGAGRLALLRRGVAAVVKAGPFHVIQGLWADEPGLIAALAGRITGARTVVSFMGGELANLPAVPYGGGLERLGPALVRGAVALATHITVGSPWLLQQLPATWRTRTVVLPLAVPGLAAEKTPSRRRLIDPSAPLRVGWVGALLPVKAPGILLAAVALARHQGAQLEVTMIGDGPLADRLQRQAQRLQVAVTFAGLVPFSAMATQLSQVDVLVQTSWWESQGMAVLEAAAGGCAVLGTHVGALASLQSALAHTSPGDVTALAAALLAADKQREQTAAAGDAAAAEVWASYGDAVCLERWQALVGG